MILKQQSPSIIIIVIYRPPSCLDCDFIDVISRAEQYILTIPAPLPNIILLGDFNFPLINWSNPNSQGVSPILELESQLSEITDTFRNNPKLILGGDFNAGVLTGKLD